MAARRRRSRRGLGPLAQGGDGGGSIRIPSSFAGLFGIKPTTGVVPYYPMPHNDLLSHLGPMTRTVADSALMLSAIAGYDASDRFSQPHAARNFLADLDAGIAGRKVFFSPTLGFAKVDGQVAEATARAGGPASRSSAPKWRRATPASATLPTSSS